MRMLWWLLAVISVGLISVALSEQRALDPVQNLSLRITSPLERGLRELALPIADFFQGIFDRGDLTRENRELRAENERLKAELARLQDAQQRFDELAGLLEVQEGRPQDKFVVANLIAQDPSNLKEAIAIDRGRNDGVEEGMIVLAEGGSLVGTVSRAYDNFAWVTLITDPDSAVNALVQAAEARGVVNGDLRRGLLLDMVPQTADLKPGLLVTTSSLGGNYPRSLLIGTIDSVDDKPQALFQVATLEPAVDLGRLETVLVLVSFLPARLVGP